MIIIMAKGTSKRLPRKNMRLLRGLPLFIHAVLYAQQEGYTPIVLTDEIEGEIGNLARTYGAKTYIQHSEELDNYDAVARLLQEEEYKGEKVIGVIQATNPFRIRGRLREMVEKVTTGGIESIYTAEEIKVNGKLGDEYRKAILPSPDTTLYRCDGGILACTPSFFLSHNNYFLGQGSVPILQQYPLTWDIDEEWQLEEAEEIAQRYPHYLPDLREGKIRWEEKKTEIGEETWEEVEVNGAEYRIYRQHNLLTPAPNNIYLPSYLIVDTRNGILTCRNRDDNTIVFDPTGERKFENKVGEVGEERRVDITIQHPRWEDRIYFNLQTMRGSRASSIDRFTVLDFKEKERVRLKWDKWGEELFTYDEKKGKYRL